MPTIDLGSVVGPQGRQGNDGATGPQGIQGPAGPNQVTGSTSTTLSGVLFGNGTNVQARALDSANGAASTESVTATRQMIAPIETTAAASRAYAVGDCFVYNGLLYKATAAIAQGGAITPDTNCAATTSMGELATYREEVTQALAGKLPIINNAGAHNSIYRGKYLGNTVTAAQYTSINAGTFDDIFIGDYWTINGVNWRVAALDYYLHYGDTECTKHHVVVVPDTCIVTGAKMNSTNIVTGAYVGSDYYTGANGNTAREDAGAIIKAAFGNDHILAHRILLQNTVPEGKGYTGVLGGWYDAHPADLMSEEMVYGCKEFKNEVAGENLAGNYTVDHGQLPLFRHDHSRICNRADWWLREVASSAAFILVSYDGKAYCDGASYAFDVRPAPAICA